MTTHNIVLEISSRELHSIVNELLDTLSEKKIVINPNQEDCIKTYLHRKGILAWIAQNVQGNFQICIMNVNTNSSYYDSAPIYNSKPWWKSSKSNTTSLYCPFSESIPILFRFEDTSDAMFFKMTYLEGN